MGDLVYHGAGIGSDVARVDGVAKVTGRARYTFDVSPPAVLQSALLSTPVSKGKILSIDTCAAEQVSGVVLILTHQNMDRLEVSKFYMNGGTLLSELSAFADG